MCPRLSANYVSCCPPNMAQVSVWAGNLHLGRLSSIFTKLMSTRVSLSTVFMSTLFILSRSSFVRFITSAIAAPPSLTQNRGAYMAGNSDIFFFQNNKKSETCMSPGILQRLLLAIAVMNISAQSERAEKFSPSALSRIESDDPIQPWNILPYRSNIVHLFFHFLPCPA